MTLFLYFILFSWKIIHIILPSFSYLHNNVLIRYTIHTLYHLLQRRLNLVTKRLFTIKQNKYRFVICEYHLDVKTCLFQQTHTDRSRNIRIFSPDPWYLIMEYLANGNLQGYLRKVRTGQTVDIGKQNGHAASTNIPPHDLLTFAVQIARGMEFLASKTVSILICMSSVESQKGVNSVLKMFQWQQEGRYHCIDSKAIAPFWFPLEHLWKVLTPFWLSADNLF